MKTVLESLNSALHHVFTKDERIYLIGQDVLDPYGGAFKVTRGLSTAFPSRVFTAPISEAGMVGVAAGMALRGLLPIVEIMFGDFLTLAADQIINHIAKFRWMYNNQVRMPVLIRTPMGGRRGYGPTHSQTLEKMLLGVPGLHVVAPTNFGNPGALLEQAVYEQEPVVFTENKLLYLLPIVAEGNDPEFDLFQQTAPGSGYPYYRIIMRGAPAPVMTITAYGYMAEIAKQAMIRLAYEFEVFTELIIYTQLSPFDLTPLSDSLRRSKRLLTVEEGGLSMGWGAEILARIAENPKLKTTCTNRVAALDLPVPASSALEAQVLPGIEHILQTARDMAAR